MHSSSHPEIEEREPKVPSTIGRSGSERLATPARSCNTILRDKLRALRASSPLYSNAELGKKLGYSAGVLSQYLSEDGCKYDGNISGVEKKIEDFLQALERRRASGIETAPAKVAAEMVDAFELIRKTSSLGAIIAASGKGKSRGIELILKQNLLAILIEATEWNRSIHGVMNALWAGCAVDGWDRRTERFPYLVQKMRGSDRPIIIDDAHKLSRESLSLLATFQEKTKCPIALIGCAELVDKLAADPQRLSRTAIGWIIKAGPDPALYRHMVRQVCKDIDGELDEVCDLCAQVGNGHGHERTVEQVLKSASIIRHADSKLTWCKAFIQANKVALRPCQLS
jgi:DNA transposition AAA+ family ATPase